MSDSHRDSAEPNWFKSSYSGGNATECVECAHITHGMLIRDSKDSQGSAIRVSHGSWASFIQKIRQR